LLQVLPFISQKYPLTRFGNRGALTAGMILTFILASIGGAAILFMLAFLTALVRESRSQRVGWRDQSTPATVISAAQECEQHHDRAA
jgi:uncharacterized membrane-anchored protein